MGIRDPRSIILTKEDTGNHRSNSDSWKTLELTFGGLGIDHHSHSLCWLLKRIDEVTSSENLPVSLWVHDADDRIHYGNHQFTRRFGDCLGRKCHRTLMDNPDSCGCCKSKQAFTTREAGSCRLCRRSNLGYDVYVVHYPVFNANEKPYVVTTSLQLETPEEVKSVLAGRSRLGDDGAPLFTCCSGCRKIRTDKGEWLAVDEYLLEMLNGRISHGICKECIERIYPYLDISA